MPVIERRLRIISVAIGNHTNRLMNSVRSSTAIKDQIEIPPPGAR